MQIFLKFIDKLSEWTGKIFAWLIIFLTLALVYEVIARYIFAAPTIWAYDISYMLYGAHFMMGAAYLLYFRGNVRIDIFYQRFSPKQQALVDLCLYPLLFFPVIIVLLIEGIEMAWHSWVIQEKTTASAWRAPIYPLRACLPVAAFFLLLAGIAEFIRTLVTVIKRR